jgi:hypothetical protein
MPNTFHQSVEDILRAATPEQRLLWNYIFLNYGERPGISQFVYYGPVTGTAELANYVARKMYFAYQLTVLNTTFGVGASAGGMMLYNEANVAIGLLGDAGAYWDATAAAPRIFNVAQQVENMIFSRLSGSGTTTLVQFVGYRITY